MVLTADLVNNWLSVAAVTKAADESVTSSTTLQNDNELLLPVVASAAWNFNCTLVYEGGAVGASDLKIQWALPAGATASICVPSYLFTDGADHGPSWLAAGTAFALGTAGAGAKRAVFMAGSVITSTTAGNLQLTWAQNTSSA